ASAWRKRLNSGISRPRDAGSPLPGFTQCKGERADKRSPRMARAFVLVDRGEPFPVPCSLFPVPCSLFPVQLQVWLAESFSFALFTACVMISATPENLGMTVMPPFELAFTNF